MLTFHFTIYFFMEEYFETCKYLLSQTSCARPPLLQMIYCPHRLWKHMLGCSFPSVCDTTSYVVHLSGMFQHCAGWLSHIYAFPILSRLEYHTLGRHSSLFLFLCLWTENLGIEEKGEGLHRSFIINLSSFTKQRFWLELHWIYKYFIGKRHNTEFSF